MPATSRKARITLKTQLITDKESLTTDEHGFWRLMLAHLPRESMAGCNCFISVSIRG
jgi:hypothetical protein